MKEEIWHLTNDFSKLPAKDVLNQSNKRFLTDEKLEEWDAAVDEYYERYGDNGQS